jgi:hypothetical protein
MVGRISAQIALLAFAIAILAGLSVGNSPALVLQRSLIALVAGLGVGQLASWSAKLVLRDHLQRKKLAIDRAHVEAVQSAASKEAASEPDVVEAG